MTLAQRSLYCKDLGINVTDNTSEALASDVLCYNAELDLQTHAVLHRSLVQTANATI